MMGQVSFLFSQFCGMLKQTHCQRRVRDRVRTVVWVECESKSCFCMFQIIQEHNEELIMMFSIRDFRIIQCMECQLSSLSRATAIIIQWLLSSSIDWWALTHYCQWSTSPMGTLIQQYKLKHFPVYPNYSKWKVWHNCDSNDGIAHGNSL